MKFVGVTSCPTGIAHTYMAAEALEQAAKDAGHEMIVETQGSAGSSPIPQATIDAADAVIFAHDLEVRDAGRFAGKPTIDVGVKKAISDGPALIQQAVEAAGTASRAAGAAGASGGGEKAYHFVGVTSCPTGIAHTYMAAESLEQAAKDAGYTMTVETQGSAGSEPLSQEEIDRADAVIFAHDLEVKDRGRFAGKPTIDVGVKKGISDGPALIQQAVDAIRAGGGAAAPVAAGTAAAGASASSGLTTKSAADEAHVGVKIRQWLMTGVSYMIPFVAAGGILIALGFMFAQIAAGENGVIDVTKFTLDASATGTPILQNIFEPLNLMHWAALLFWVGKAAFGFLVPILSGFIAFGIADRPGLVPGITGGAIASLMGAGFLGGIATGFIAGFTARWIAGWKVHKGVRGVMPVVVIPLLSTLVTGGVMVLLLGRPIKALMDAMGNGLNSLAAGGGIVALGAVLGLMMGFDLGGPVNKTAYTFATAGLAQSGNVPLQIMAAVMAAGMVAPLGMALATAVRPTLFTPAEKENGRAAWLLGFSFISEGAIPFAAADPARVIASSMVGSAVTGGLVMLFGNTLRAPHGGLWVTPLISNPLMYLVAIAIGAAVTAGLVIVLKSSAAKTTVETA